ncbi:MAG: DUF1223 domain-containing protein [Alphaproteobacteria bacterium]|nr:DUF1223 domain-containing protein [Alphaproteobacteria bacterium]
MHRKFLTGLLAAAALSLPAPAAVAGDPPVVVELFTSQGCSSCPPADALIGELAMSGGIIALSYHVDIWDTEAFRDPLSNPEFTLRQRDYQKRLGAGYVFTPQAMINGRTSLVASRKSEMMAAIAQGRADLAAGPSLDLTLEGENLTLRIGAAGPGQTGAAKVWLLRILSATTVDIAGGENKGRTITYAHVVREMAPWGDWTGAEMTLTAPRKGSVDGPIDTYAVLLQDGSDGPIHGAALLRMTATAGN